MMYIELQYVHKLGCRSIGKQLKNTVWIFLALLVFQPLIWIPAPIAKFFGQFMYNILKDGEIMKVELS